MCVPGQPSPPFRLLGVSINRCHDDVLFEPIQLGYKILNLLLDIFGVLRTCALVVRGGNPLNPYLIMPDECAHPAKG